jgi:hypothetical protein
MTAGVHHLIERHITDMLTRLIDRGGVTMSPTIKRPRPPELLSVYHLLEQLAGDVRALQLAVHRWIAQRERRLRSQRPETPRQASGGAR